MANGFIDKARITVRAGNGGNGAVAFHREKYIAAGGPDGGDGGSGGSIILKVDDNMSTLMDFRYKRKYVAGNGVDGQGGRKTGKDGESLTIKVPRGTLVRDAESGEIIKDMSDDKPYVLCRGGRGGWGNQHFATPTRQEPRFAKAGLPGESHDVVLELKDVPAGKCKIYVYHDENGNYQLDREDGVPMEYCAIVDWEVKENTETVVVPLVDVRKGMKK